MPTQYRFTMTMFNEVVVAAMKAAAAARQQSVADFVTKAIQAALIPAAPSVPHVYSTDSGCPRCDRIRAREETYRRQRGQAIRTVVQPTVAAPRVVPREKKCPVCDRMFMPNARGAGGEQEYCRFNGRRCSGYFNRAGKNLALARRNYEIARRMDIAKGKILANF